MGSDTFLDIQTLRKSPAMSLLAGLCKPQAFRVLRELRRSANADCHCKARSREPFAIEVAAHALAGGE